MDAPSTRYISEQERILLDNYFKCAVSLSHLMGSITGILTDYICSAFPKNYFKTIWNTMEEPYAQRSKAFQDLMLKPRPIMIIDPKFDPSEDSDFRPLSEFDNDVANDPNMDIKYGLRGAQLLAEDTNYQLYFRPRRYKMSYNISFIFDSDMQRMQTQQFIRGSIRHKLPIPLIRYIENSLPSEYLKAVAKMNGYEIHDPKFEKFMNLRSSAPIRYRFRTGSGNHEFFATIRTPIEVHFEEGPSSNGPVKRGNIVVSSSFSETVDIEFVAASMYFLRTNKDPGTTLKPNPNGGYGETDYSVEDTMKVVAVDNFVNKEVPIGAEKIGNFTKYRSVHVQADKSGDDTVNLRDAIFDEEVQSMIKFYEEIGKTTDFLNVMVYEDIYQMDVSRLVFNRANLNLTIKDMTLYKDYHIVIYIDFVRLNAVKANLFKTDGKVEEHK